MFNNSLKKEAIRIHDQALERYNSSRDEMSNKCESLYMERTDAIDSILFVEKVINSIANTPKEFDTKLGEIKKELDSFKETEEYANKAYAASVKAGVGIVGSAAVGVGVAAMAPTALMGIATTFGTASTGTAISALSGAAAKKAAVAWIGRTFANFAVEGAGMAAGNAFLALAGPIGWGITAASTGISLMSLNKENKEIADNAVEEAKEIAKARESLDETTEKINALIIKTDTLEQDISNNKNRMIDLMNLQYTALGDEEKLFLGAMVNNTLSLSKLLNETID